MPRERVTYMPYRCSSTLNSTGQCFNIVRKVSKKRNIRYKKPTISYATMQKNHSSVVISPTCQMWVDKQSKEGPTDLRG